VRLGNAEISETVLQSGAFVGGSHRDEKETRKRVLAAEHVLLFDKCGVEVVILSF
jgi:hypothetical protein